MVKRLLYFYAAFVTGILVLAPPAAAQLPNNATIQGSYYFRYLGVDTTSTTNKAISAIGTMTFDGTTDATTGGGKYTISGTKINSNGAGNNTTTTLSASGSYFVFSNSLVTLAGPFTSAPIFAAIGSGPTIVGSSTDSVYCDQFIAIPVGSNLSSGTLNGNYYVASLEVPNGDFTQIRDTFFTIAADGKGALGNVTVKGTALNLNNAAQTQTSAAATYSVGGAGNGTLTLPAPTGVAAASQLLTGAKTLYVSPDGNTFIAGNGSGFDLIVGVKALSGSSNTNPLSGLYFTGLLEDDEDPTNGIGMYASQGVSNEGSGGVELGYERANSPVFGYYDNSYSDTFTFNSNGAVTFSVGTGGSQYAAGAGGNVVVGAGLGSTYLLNLYVKAPALNGTGVFLNPQGVVNAASYAPFEAQIAPGEFLWLSGSGLSTQTAQASALPFPKTLGNVQVTITDINGNTANMPLYYVNSNNVYAIVPFTAPSDGSLVTIQVINNGTKSNAVQLYSGTTSPGMFTLAANGIGDGSILHLDYTKVTPTNPAKVGEIVQIFLSGLGVVNDSTVAAGAAGPTNPLATVANALDVYIDGVLANPAPGKPTDFFGLAPGLAGLYQINVTIPSGVTTGSSVYVDISTIDAYNSQATIPISK